MESLLSWIGVFGGALVVVATAVAWWEHLDRTARPEAAHADPQVLRSAKVDVSLDDLDAVAPGDSAQRQATLDVALDRMARPDAASARPDGAPARPSAEIIRGPWIDTRPMIQAGAPEETPRA